nr:MAG TPA: hypothetical protein [Bacteriophage sp.]
MYKKALKIHKISRFVAIAKSLTLKLLCFRVQYLVF